MSFGRPNKIVDVKVAGDRRECLDLRPEIQAEKGRMQVDVAEIEGAADEGMVDRADLLGQAGCGRGVLAAIEHPKRLHRQLHAVARTDICQRAQRVPLHPVQALDLGGRRCGNATMLDQHRGAGGAHPRAAPTAAL